MNQGLARSDFSSAQSAANPDQTEALAERLREIGFSDRAVNMIVEQVESLDPPIAKTDPEQSEYQAEYSQGYAAYESEPQRYWPGILLAIAGIALSIVFLVISWSGLIAPETGLSILTAGEAGSSAGVESSKRLQAILLGIWLVVPPVYLFFERQNLMIGDNETGRLESCHVYTGAIWLSVATLLLVLFAFSS